MSITELVLSGVLLLALGYQLFFYIRYIGAPARKMRRDKKRAAQPTSHEPKGVSVIICAKNEVDNLSDYLLSILHQDYPLFEVIVVDDGSYDNSVTMLEQLRTKEPRLRLTFVPKDARVRSSKKLGITLAAKAATYDYLILTDADCRPESPHWISAMMEGFNAPQVEIVLGYGAYFERKGLLNQMIQYDTIFNSLHYLGCAIAHRPYMGVGRNLAYKKDLFFRSGTFSDQMYIRSGDDDLLVNKLATRHNTAVVVSPQATTWSVPKSTWREWWLQKKRHLSVSPHYSARSKAHLALEPMTRYTFYGVFIALMVLFAQQPMTESWPLMLILAGLFCLRVILQWATMHPAQRRLGHRPIRLGTIVWDIVLPIFSGVLMSQRSTFTPSTRW